MRKIKNINEIQTFCLDILKHLDIFCRENNIKYYIIGGTLLGAVRHRGFIPWDDDIDLLMPRTDYKRFISLYNNSRNDRYVLSCKENCKDYIMNHAKLSDNRTLRHEPAVTLKSPLGVNIDIFPLDYFPDNDLVIKLTRIITFRLRWFITLKRLQLFKKRQIYKTILLAIFKIILLPFSYKLLLNLVTGLSTKYNNKETRFAINMVEMTYSLGNEKFEKNWFNETIELEFEGNKFLAPKDYDNILKTLYGNYMQLPPIEKRIGHMIDTYIIE